jgi:hypothetical protein
MQLSTGILKNKLLNPKCAELAVLKNETSMASFLLLMVFNDETSMLKAIMKSKQVKVALPGLKTEKTMTTLPPKTISRLFAVTFLPTVSTTPNPAIAIPLQESAINNVVNEPQREPPNTVLQASTHTPQTETNLSEFNSENCQSSVTLMHLDSPDSPSQPSYKRIREFANYDHPTTEDNNEIVSNMFDYMEQFTDTATIKEHESDLINFFNLSYEHAKSSVHKIKDHWIDLIRKQTTLANISGKHLQVLELNKLKAYVNDFIVINNTNFSPTPKHKTIKLNKQNKIINFSYNYNFINFAIFFLIFKNDKRNPTKSVSNTIYFTLNSSSIENAEEVKIQVQFCFMYNIYHYHLNNIITKLPSLSQHHLIISNIYISPKLKTTNNFFHYILHSRSQSKLYIKTCNKYTLLFKLFSHHCHPQYYTNIILNSFFIPRILGGAVTANQYPPTMILYEQLKLATRYYKNNCTD